MQGTALYKSTRQITGLGFVYTGENWNFNLTLLHIGETKPNGPQAERIVNAYNVLKNKSDSTDDDNDTALTLPLLPPCAPRGDEININMVRV